MHVPPKLTCFCSVFLFPNRPSSFFDSLLPPLLLLLLHRLASRPWLPHLPRILYLIWPPVSRYSHLFGDDNRDDVLEQLESLMMTHSLEDIRIKARMVHSVISSSGSGGGGESGAE